jgi:hypothetical protein
MKTKATSHKISYLKISRLDRVCDFCGKPINKGSKYGKTNMGYIYCEGCK